jgi:diguanylate cyclase (GGDEF)-like protein
MTVLISHGLFSLRKSLILLVGVCVVPTALLVAGLAYKNYELQLEQVRQRAAMLAGEMMAHIDRELSGVESALKVLATSPELARGDLQAFHARARAALPAGLVYNYILTDVQGAQVINTLRPFGEPLPRTGTPAQLAAVFSQARPVLTDVFIGPVTHRPAIAMGVPVVVDGGVKYSLNIGLSPDRITDIIRRYPLPESWLAAALDRSGAIAGRSRDAERYVGQKSSPDLLQLLTQPDRHDLVTTTKEGIPVYTAVVGSARWGWHVAVGAPTSQFTREVGWRMVGAVLFVGLTLALALWLAQALLQRVLHSVRALNDAALALVSGQAMTLPKVQMVEAQAVSAAMLQAASAMEKARFLAQHDVLTDLPNRLMFHEEAERSLSMALRNGQTLALLSIDLDGFKSVNDTHGHAAGDQVLRVVAQRLGRMIRGFDVAARLGGDEFMVLLHDVQAQQAMASAERIIEALSDPYPGITISLSASVGVAMYPSAGLDVQALLVAADRAMYRAKAAGKHGAELADTRT